MKQHNEITVGAFLVMHYPQSTLSDFSLTRQHNVAVYWNRLHVMNMSMNPL